MNRKISSLLLVVFVLSCAGETLVNSTICSKNRIYGTKLEDGKLYLIEAIKGEDGKSIQVNDVLWKFENVSFDFLLAEWVVNPKSPNRDPERKHLTIEFTPVGQGKTGISNWTFETTCLD